METLLTPTVLGYVAIALIVLFVVLKSIIPAKADTIEKIEGAVYKAFNFAEKAIPDDLQGDSPVAKSLSKADVFLKKFCELYESQHGKPPTDAEKNQAVTMVEKLVYTQNLQK